MVRVVRRCETGRVRCLGLALSFVLASVVPSAAADDQAPPVQPRAAAPALPTSADFLFGAPHGWLSIRSSLLVPRAGGDLFSFVEEQLTLDHGDFRSGGLAADVGVALTPQLDVVGGFDINRKESSSEYRHFVAPPDSQPITQSTRLRQTTVSGGMRYSPLGRGRSVSRYAFIPRRVVPYAGAGATLGFYDFSQRGQFVDYADLSIFNDRFASDGTAVGPYVDGGVDLQVWKRLFVTFNARYTWLHADLGTDFSGFDGIDLAGFRGGSGISIVF
jgi:hypothetical protein